MNRDTEFEKEFKRQTERRIKEMEGEARQLKSLQEFRSVGEIFNYCGIRMLVESIFFNGFHSSAKHYGPVLTAAYRNARGELSREEFTPSQLLVLIAENEGNHDQTHD